MNTRDNTVVNVLSRVSKLWKKETHVKDTCTGM